MWEQERRGRRNDGANTTSSSSSTQLPRSVLGQHGFCRPGRPLRLPLLPPAGCASLLSSRVMGNAWQTPPLRAPPTDFLPFRCDGCDSSHCLRHRLPESHSCPGAAVSVSITCPLCSAVFPVPGGDVEAAWAAHNPTCAKPSGEAGPKKKKRCPAKGCKELLGPINAVNCARCTELVCMRCVGSSNVCGPFVPACSRFQLFI